jgi:hypothetical protein
MAIKAQHTNTSIPYTAVPLKTISSPRAHPSTPYNVSTYNSHHYNTPANLSWLCHMPTLSAGPNPAKPLPSCLPNGYNSSPVLEYSHPYQLTIPYVTSTQFISAIQTNIPA